MKTAEHPQVFFQGTEIRVVSYSGERWVPMVNLAIALGYAHQHRVGDIVDRNPEEFTGKQGVLKMSTPGGIQDFRVLNYRGVIRVAMKSDAPKAIAFRDWAEEVLFQVMTTGSYNPGITGDTDGPLHWTERLTPSERLRLVELREKIIAQMAADPGNRIHSGALMETYGGPGEFQEYLRCKRARGIDPQEVMQPDGTAIGQRRGKLAKDPEVMEAVDRFLKTGMTLQAIHRALVERFGRERAVSAGTISDYARRKWEAERERRTGPLAGTSERA